MHHLFVAAFAGVLLMGTATQARMGRCGYAHPPTLHRDAREAKFVLYARVLPPGQDSEKGHTDFLILQVLKGEKFQRWDVIRLPHEVEVEKPNYPPHLVLFGEQEKGKPSFYRGMMGSTSLAEYVRGLSCLDPKDRLATLRHCFRYLQNSDPEVARDAYLEFSRADVQNLRAIGRVLPRQPVRRLIQAEPVDSYRDGLWAYLLGVRGNAEDGALVRQVLDKKLKQESPSGLDQALIAYTLLRPKEGWAITRRLATDPKAEILHRLAAGSATRYFYESHPSVIAKKDVVDLMSQFLTHEDLADFAIEAFRQWENWQYTKPILALWGKKGVDWPLIQRSILRYALACPAPETRTFLANLRANKSSLLEEVEESERERKAAETAARRESGS